jgi:hypothetical protein
MVEVVLRGMHAVVRFVALNLRHRRSFIITNRPPRSNLIFRFPLPLEDPARLQRSCCFHNVFACLVCVYNLRVVLSVSDDREMASTEPVHSRKWNVDQESLFLELLVMPEFKPIGGDGDGIMERKDEVRWAPLLARFQAELKFSASSS